jgi:carboxypeptidase T
MKLLNLTCSALATLAGLSLSPLAAAHGGGLSALYEQEKARGDVYEAYFPDLDTARRAAISFHGQLLESNYDQGHLILELDDADQERLRVAGFTLKPAHAFLARRQALLSLLQARAASGRPSLLGRAAGPATEEGTESIPSFPCYETVEETFAAAEALVAAQPKLAQWIDIGNSWQKANGLGGYDLKVLKLTNSKVNTPDKPKLFINAAIHAREYATAPLVLAFATELLNGHGTDADATWILDHHEVHLLLQTNPDGRKKAETGLLWRKNTNTAYCGANSNDRGADLNRNFSYSWNLTGGQGSSGNSCSETYRGPSAGSEPEVQAVQAYVRSLWADRRGAGLDDPAPADTSGIHLDIHSYSQLVLWPWGVRSAPAPNGTALQTLGRKFAFFNNYTPMQSIGLYPTDGTSDAVSYGELGVAAYTFEIGTSFFQSCSSYTNTIKPQNLNALRYAAKVVRTPYQTPAGPDTTAVSVAPAKVTAGQAATLSASATDLRFNNSQGTEPTQNIVAAEYYIDTPPWQAGAVARPLLAADGAFNAKTESLTASVPTAGLSRGKHLLFVRAQDAAGNWGAFSATFLKVK